MLPDDQFDLLRKAAATLDRESRFVTGEDIRRRVPDISALQPPTHQRSRSPYVLAVAAVALALLVGGTLLRNAENLPEITLIDPAGPNEAQAGPAIESEQVESDQSEPADVAEEAAIESDDDAVEDPRRSIVSRAPAPETEPSDDETAIDDSVDLGQELTTPDVEDVSPADPVSDDHDQATGTTTVPGSTSLGPSPSTRPEVSVDARAASTDTQPQALRASTVYETFSPDVYLGAAGPTDRQSMGFAPDSTWELSGAGSMAIHPDGLDYTDAAGNDLISYPGSVSFSPSDRLVVTRPLAGTFDPADMYLVSFIVQVSAPGHGHAFWTPADVHNQGAFGVQQSGHIRFVNGPTSLVPIVPGASTFVVARFSNGLAELWVNPNLVAPGPAHVVYPVVSAPSLLATFSIGRLDEDVSYRIDEFRMGYTWSSVAPYGG